MMVSGADRDSSAAALHSAPLRSFGWMEGRGMEVGGAVGLRSYSPHHGGGPHQVGNGGAVRLASRCLHSQCPPCNNAWMKGSENRPKDQCLSENFNFFFFSFIVIIIIIFWAGSEGSGAISALEGFAQVAHGPKTLVR